MEELKIKIKGFLSLFDYRRSTSTGEKSKNRHKEKIQEYSTRLVCFSLKSIIFLKCFMFSYDFKRKLNSMHSSYLYKFFTDTNWRVFIFSWLYWLSKFILIYYFLVKTLFIWLNFDDDVFSFCLMFFNSTLNDFGIKIFHLFN